MAHRAYVGNLPFSFAKADLENLFAAFGTVRSAEIIIDRETGRSRGFGFVELDSSEQLQAAIAGLNGKPLSGRSLNVTEARDRETRGPAGGAPRFGGAPGGFSGGFRSGPPRAPGAAPTPPRETSPRAPSTGDAPSRGKPDRDADRAPRRGRGMDDYDRHDKSWRRGKNDGWE